MWSAHEKIPALIQLQKQLTGRNMALLGVALDEPAKKIARFREQKGINYPLLLDEGRQGDESL